MTYPTDIDLLDSAHAPGQTIASADANKVAIITNALQTKVGKGSSTPTVGKVLKGTGGTDTGWTNIAHSELTGVDTDTGTSAIHHTLGVGANQAAAGNHTHAAGSSGPYTIVTGDNTGVTAVTATVAAIYAAGGTPYFPPGIWLVGGLVPPSGSTTLGAGIGVTTLKQAASTDYVFRPSAGASDILLSGFTVDGTLGNTGHVPIDFRGGPTRCGVDGVRVINTPGNMGIFFANNGATSATAWSAATAYSVGQFVTYQQRFYVVTATRSANATPPDWDTSHFSMTRGENFIRNSVFDNNFIHISVNNVTGTVIDNVLCTRGTQTTSSDAHVTISDAPWTKISRLRSLYGRTQGLQIVAGSDYCQLDHVESAYNTGQNRDDIRGLTINGGKDGIATNCNFHHNGENGAIVFDGGGASTGWSFGQCNFNDNWTDNPTSDPSGAFAGSQQGGHGCEVLVDNTTFTGCAFDGNRSGLWANHADLTVYGGHLSNNRENGYAGAGATRTRFFGTAAISNGSSNPTAAYDGFNLGVGGGTDTYFRGIGIVARNASGTSPQRLGVNIPSGSTSTFISGGVFQANFGIGASEQVYRNESTSVLRTNVGIADAG